MESNEQTELPSKTETFTDGEQMTVIGWGEMAGEGSSRKEKGLRELDNSVVIARWRRV